MGTYAFSLKSSPAADFKMRIAVLRATQLMRRSFDNGGAGWLDALEEVDACLETLAQRKFWLFEGILSASAARFVVLVAQNRLRLSIGQPSFFVLFLSLALEQLINLSFPPSTPRIRPSLQRRFHPYRSFRRRSHHSHPIPRRFLECCSSPPPTPSFATPHHSRYLARVNEQPFD